MKTETKKKVISVTQRKKQGTEEFRRTMENQERKLRVDSGHLSDQSHRQSG